jgi:MoxR-like ATPase
MNRKEKIKGLLEGLTQGLYERDEVIKLALLSALAGESIFLLGPPGVGKSLIARRLKYAFRQARSFEYLMTRFSTPEEVFGPVSIQKLKEEDKYERKTEAYMPGANLVFLDEIWKASSSIQNALLTIINEKVYRNGEQEIAVDLKSLITASNELPPEGENFGPLYDRLLIRYHLQGISGGKRFIQMITGTEEVYSDTVPEEYKLSKEELNQWQNEIQQIEVPEEVLNTIQVIREKIEAYNQKQKEERLQIKVYDRRWKKIIRLLRTSAFLNERAAVNLMDCFLMTHCLWNRPEQYEEVAAMVSDTIRKHGYSLQIGLPMLRREIKDFEAEVESEVKIRHTTTEEVLRPVDDTYYELQKNGEDFAGRYVQVNDYNRLKVADQEVVNLYDEDFKLVNRLGAQKTEEEYTLTLKHNAQTHRLRLKTYQKEKARYLYKKPHKLVHQYWEERYEKINQYLTERRQWLEEQKPEALQQGPGHILVDEKLWPVVEANHRQVKEELEDRQFQLDKIRHLYQNIEE